MNRLALVLILLGAAIYGGAMIARSSVVVDGERVFTLHDDELISLTYARNLAQGNGCVWYPGYEKIQGYSNPGWVAIMTVPFLLGMSNSLAPLFIQILGLLLVLVAAYFAGRIGEELSGSKTAGLMATALVALSYNLMQMAVVGFESIALAAIGMVVAWLMIGKTYVIRVSAADAEIIARCKEPGTIVPYHAGKRPIRDWLMPVLLALGVLIRLDFLPIALVFVLWMALEKRGNWKVALGSVLGMAALVFFGSYAYYGSGAGVTAQLKLTGFPILLRWTRGLTMLYESFSWHGLLVMLLPLMFFRDKRARWLLGIVGITLAYEVFVGGDAWPTNLRGGRWFLTAYPIILTLVAWAFWKIAGIIAKPLRHDS